MSDRAGITALAIAADAITGGQLARGWVDTPGVVLAILATFCCVISWVYKERPRR